MGIKRLELELEWTLRYKHLRNNGALAGGTPPPLPTLLHASLSLVAQHFREVILFTWVLHPPPPAPLPFQLPTPPPHHPPPHHHYPPPPPPAAAATTTTATATAAAAAATVGTVTGTSITFLAVGLVPVH